VTPTPRRPLARTAGPRASATRPWRWWVVLLPLAFAGGALAEETAQESGADPSLGADLAGASTAILQADAARDEGRWNEAAESYWKARKANPAEFRTHVRYQEMCLRAGDKRDALFKDYDALAEEYAKYPQFRLLRMRLDPPADRLAALELRLKEQGGSPDLALEIADAALAVGDPARALKALYSPFGKAPPEGRVDEALFLRLRAELASGARDAARKRVEETLKTRPDHREALLFLARLDLEDQRHDAAIEGARKVLLGRPMHVAATLVLAEALARTGKRDEAIAALETPLRVAKDLPEILVPLGDLVASQETEVAYAKATEVYAKVPAGHPLHARAVYGGGWILERQGKLKEAEEAYRKALAADPGWTRAIHSVGFCAMKQGRVSEAQVQFKKALDLDPSLVPAMLDLGASYDEQADYAAALKQYEKVLKTKGHQDNLRALVNSAFDHEALGAFNKATDFLLRAHKIAPTDADIMVWLGDNMYFQEKWKEAEKWYQKAVQTDEKSFFGWRGLGFALGHQRRWADAVAALERARLLRPTDTDVLLALGDIYSYETEDLEKALKAYEEYVAAGGQNQSVPPRIEEIKNELGK
jgi:tetratricopeptide (TPR) repeat protein